MDINAELFIIETSFSVIDWGKYFEDLEKNQHPCILKSTILYFAISKRDVPFINKLGTMNYPFKYSCEWNTESTFFPITRILLNLTDDLYMLEKDEDPLENYEIIRDLQVLEALVLNGANWKDEWMENEEQVETLTDILSSQVFTKLDYKLKRMTDDKELLTVVMSIIDY